MPPPADDGWQAPLTSFETCHCDFAFLLDNCLPELMSVTMFAMAETISITTVFSRRADEVFELGFYLGSRTRLLSEVGKAQALQCET
jgi:hypothetical protein